MIRLRMGNFGRCIHLDWRISSFVEFLMGSTFKDIFN